MKVKLHWLRQFAERPYLFLIREIRVMSCCNLVLCLYSQSLADGSLAFATFPTHFPANRCVQ